MTQFPHIEMPSELSRRMSELLHQSTGFSPDLSDGDVSLVVNDGKFDLEYGAGHDPFSKLWFESMRFFLERRKGDWGVLFQLGVRDLENYWRDQNTQEVFEISQEHLDFESAWQSLMAQKLAVHLGNSHLIRSFQGVDYPQQVKSCADFMQGLNLSLKPYVEFELISFEKKEVLQKEEEKRLNADRLVFSLGWGTQGMTWTDSTKRRWTKNFVSKMEEVTSKMTVTPVKWVAEGGQFP